MGDVVELTPTVTPSDAANKTLGLLSDVDQDTETEYVSVDGNSDGLKPFNVTLKTAGTGFVTISATDNGNDSFSIKVPIDIKAE